MVRKKVLLLLVGVATTTLMGVGIHVRADKKTDTPSRTYARPNNKSISTVIQKNQKPKNSSKDTTVKSEPALNETPALQSSSVIWQENFGSYAANVPNPAYWNTAGASQPIYNNEQQKYDASSQTVRVEGGNLIIEAHKTPTGYISGLVNTKGKISITQGTRLEARIKLPKGRGVWPAFWLLSNNQPHTSKLNPTNADWESERFYTRDGEIDIMESYGTYPGVVEATVHTFAQSIEQQLSLGDEGFHTYWMEWRADKLIMGVDSRTISTYAASFDTSKWPFTADNQMYVILNLAMGGSGGGSIVTSPTDSWKMYISSIVYSKLQ